MPEGNHKTDKDNDEDEIIERFFFPKFNMLKAGVADIADHQAAEPDKKDWEESKKKAGRLSKPV